MTQFLTSKELQEVLQVDRSTIYRMAEDGRLPAMKVGRQWRFPADRIGDWLGGQTSSPLPEPQPSNDGGGSLATMLPAGYVQSLGDLVGELLGVMVVVTDMEGIPIAGVGNACGLFGVVNTVDGAVERCIVGWRELASGLDLSPRFTPSHLNLLCARSYVRVGSELKGMVLAGGIAPDAWPPSPEGIDRIAAEFNVAPHVIEDHIDEVYHLNPAERSKVLEYLPRVGHVLSHIASERTDRLATLDAIAALAVSATPTKERP